MVGKALSFEMLELPSLHAELQVAAFPEDTAAAELLLREYFAWLELPNSHRGFEEEMHALSAHYSGDAGLLLLLKQGQHLLACVALQRHDANTAEVRRLYVRERYQGHGYGELLMKHIIEKAAALGYHQLVLAAIPKQAKRKPCTENWAFSPLPRFIRQRGQERLFIHSALQTDGTQAFACV